MILMMELREMKANRTWRPFGYWMLTLNASFGLPLMYAFAVLDVGVDHLGTLAGAYASVLAAWAAGAGIRQWGKNTGTEQGDEK